MTHERKLSLSIKVDFGGGARLGAGKIMLLKHIVKTGSISAAGRAMDMSYRRAWLLVEEMNSMFARPVVTSHSGGKQGGGAELTKEGRDVIRLYEAIVSQSAKSSSSTLKKLTNLQGKPLKIL